MLKEIGGFLKNSLSAPQAEDSWKRAGTKAKETYDEIKKALNLPPELADLVIRHLRGIIALGDIENRTTNILYQQRHKSADTAAIKLKTSILVLEQADIVFANNSQAAEEAARLASRIAFDTLDLLERNPRPKKSFEQRVKLQLLPICNQLQELWRNSQEQTPRLC